MSQSFKDKTALVTGATRGLGYHLALELAKQGAHIIALGRTVGSLEALDDEIKSVGSQATLVPLNLLELETIDALGPTLFERFDKLDLLVGNAAYLGGLAPISHFKTDEWNKVLTTNLTANFSLLRTLDPLLQRSENATALFITDQDESTRGAAYWGPITASKAALEVLVKSYAAETQETSMRTLLVNPGPMSTNLRQKAFPGEDQSGLNNPETIAKRLVTTLLENTYENGETLDVSK